MPRTGPATPQLSRPPALRNVQPTGPSHSTVSHQPAHQPAGCVEAGYTVSEILDLDMSLSRSGP